jgi:AsmA protein
MKLLRIFGIVLAVLVIVLVALPFVVDANHFRPTLESELTSALGRPVSVGNLSLSIFSGGVSARDLSIADDPAFSHSPFLQAKSLSVGVEMLPLIFSRKIDVTAVKIDQPQIVLLQNPSGAWNYANLGSKAASSQPSAAPSRVALSVNLITITNGRLTIAKTSGHGKPLLLEDANIDVKNFSPSSAMPFSLAAKLAGGGELKLDGKAGPLNQANLEETPVAIKLQATHLDPVASGMIAPEAGIGGLVTVDSTGDSDGKRIQFKGKINADQLKLVKGGSPATRPVEFDFALQHVLATRSGSLLQGDIRIGKADAKLTGVYNPNGESMALKADLSGPSMAVQELAGILPALNVVLPAGVSLQGGTASAKMSVEGPIENLSAAGSLGLTNTKLAGFDFGKNMSQLASLAGIQPSSGTEIQTLSADVKQNQQGTSLENIKLTVVNVGDLTGAGTISPARALDFKMRVTLQHGAIPPVLGGATMQAGIPFMIHGTAADPKFEPDVKGMLTNETGAVKSDAVKAASGVLGGMFGKKKN